MSNDTYKKPKNKLKYTKWGYIFIAPFFIVYIAFSLYPLLSTFYYSTFMRYQNINLETVQQFIGLDNYKTLFEKGDIFRYFGNTFIIWMMGFIPQIVLSLLFASWFTDLRLKLKGTGFFKVVLYLPNIIMASSMAVLFFTLFSARGPVNDVVAYITNNKEYLNSVSVRGFDYWVDVWATRGIAAFINYLMWVGNTTILLMAGIMGIDTSLYEASSIDGANARQTFWRLTMPLLKPIMMYVLITSIIGGVQMFDIPQLLTSGTGAPDRTSMTVVMNLNEHLASRNVGMGGAVSVLLFIVGGILSLMVYFMALERPKRTVKRKKKGGADNGGE